MKKSIKESTSLIISELKKSGWAFVLIYILLVANLFTVQGQGIVIGVILILIAIFFDFLNRKKNSKSPSLKIIRKIVASIKLAFVILVGVGIIFSPSVGPIGVPFSFVLFPGLIIFIAHIIYLVKDIKNKNKYGVFWCLFVLIFYPVAIYINTSLWEKGIEKMKIHSIKMHEVCNLEKKCKVLNEPWTKDYKKVEVKGDTFRSYITFMETYYTFTGGLNQDLILDIQNIDIDYEGKNKKIFKYSENKWMPVK